MELKLEISDMRDYFIPQRNGDIVQTKRVTFYLGKFGPFVENFEIEGFSADVVKVRAAALRQALEDMHR